MTQPSDPGDAPLKAFLPLITSERSLMVPQSQSTNNLPYTQTSKPLGRDDLSSSTPDLFQPKSRSLHRPRLHDYERSPSTSARSSSPRDLEEDPRQTILRSYAPRIAVYASADAETFIKSKGFTEGFKGLLRSFGERIQGKVVVRDSVGASRGWEDFGIRFIEFESVQHPENPRSSGSLHNGEANVEANASRHSFDQLIPNYDHGSAAPIDKIVGQYLRSADVQSFDEKNGHHGSEDKSQRLPSVSSPLYILYLRKLLSSMPFVPYETFSHPVACVIAVSSHNPGPIEVLRQLYANTSRGGDSTPAWINSDYLRYYVLIHDEEKDDITKSTALFDLMKRHFGLNCHLLRLRSSQCVQTDDDSIRVPPCQWLSAEEELAKIRMRGMSVVH